MSDQHRRTWDKALRALGKMRKEGVSAKDAAHDSDISPSTLRRWLGNTLRKNGRGRLRANTGDSFLRPLRVLTPDGLRDILVKGTRRASQISRHWIAVNQLLDATDLHALEKFKGMSIVDASGNEFPLLTLKTEVKRFGAAGVFTFESIYVGAI